MSLNREYKNLIKQMEKLSEEFDSRINDFDLHVIFNPQAMLDELKIYQKKLNKIFNKFLEMSINKYPFIKKLHENFLCDLNAKIEYLNFQNYAEEKLRELFTKIPKMRKNGKEEFNKFLFIRGCEIFNKFEDNMEYWRERAKTKMNEILKTNEKNTNKTKEEKEM